MTAGYGDLTCAVVFFHTVLSSPVPPAVSRRDRGDIQMEAERASYYSSLVPSMDCAYCVFSAPEVFATQIIWLQKVELVS